MSQMQQKHKENTARLQAEVQLCQQNCRLLEEENTKLKQALAALESRFAMLGGVFNNTEVFAVTAAAGAAATNGRIGSPGSGGVVTPPGEGVLAATAEAATTAPP